MLFLILETIVNVLFAFGILKNANKLIKREDLDKEAKYNILRTIYKLVIFNICLNILGVLIFSIVTK